MYSRASRKKLIQIILVEYFQKLFKLDGTLIETAVSNSKKHFFNTLCKPSSATAHCLYYTALHCYTAYTAHIAHITGRTFWWKWSRWLKGVSSWLNLRIGMQFHASTSRSVAASFCTLFCSMSWRFLASRLFLCRDNQHRAKDRLLWNFFLNLYSQLHSIKT